MKERVANAEQSEPSFEERYVQGLIQLAPIEVGLTQGIRHGDTLNNPDDMRHHLEGMGYEESLWDELLDERKVSHDVRALIITAMSDQPRSFTVLKVNLRLLDELDGLIQPMEDISDRTLARTDWHTPALQQRLTR